jgi:hypothetical protein
LGAFGRRIGRVHATSGDQARAGGGLEESPRRHLGPEEDRGILLTEVEERTLVHHLLQRPVVLGYCAPERRRRLTHLLDALRFDEIGHIAYTARLIEGFVRRGEAGVVKRLMPERMSDFNAITNQDLGRNVFESV